jgi:hypothetical protein
MSTGEPAATESGHGWFGGGPSEKDQVNWHLVGGLPYRTAGSASGLGKRTGSNPGTAPQADSTIARQQAGLRPECAEPGGAGAPAGSAARSPR